MKRDILFKTVLLPCVMLTATVALATSETFEDGTENAAFSKTDWSAGGIIKAGSPAHAVGNPITGTSSGTKVLDFEGQVVRTHTTAEGKDATKSTIDFLLYAGEAGDDSTSFEDTETGVQIALTTGALKTEGASTVNLMLYCIPRGGESTADWVTVGSAAKDSWLRVTFAMDYTAGRARVSVNGEPLVSTHGYADETETDVNKQGAWYALATSGRNVGTLTFAGVAQIDEVVVAEATAVSGEGATSEMPTVTYSGNVNLTGNNANTYASVTRTEMNKWGVTAGTANAIKLDDSGHTVLEKVELGYEPDDSKKFVPASMVLLTSDGGEQHAQITFPLPTRTNQPTYTLVITDGQGNDIAGIDPATVVAGSTTDDEDAGTRTVKFELPTDNTLPKVLKFKLKATGATN